MKYYVTQYTAFWKPESISGRPVRHRYLIEGQIVEDLFDMSVTVNTERGPRTCLQVTFNDGIHDPLTGFVSFEDLNPYLKNFPSGSVEIVNQTPSLLDSWQYMTYAGKVVYNFCGQFCIAEAKGLGIMDVLDGWKAKDRKWWETFFNTKTTVRGTSDGELLRLSRVLGIDAVLLSDAMRMPESKSLRYTPYGLAKEVERGHVIASVNVDPVTHLLNGSGILHWVLVKEVFMDRAGAGYVKFWNSLNDAIELETWRGWRASAKEPYGVVLQR